FAIGRPLIRVDFEGTKVRQLSAGAAVQRLQPQIVYSFFTDRINDTFAVGTEAWLPLMPRVVLERSQDLAGIKRNQGDRRPLGFEIVGAQRKRLSVAGNVEI